MKILKTHFSQNHVFANWALVEFTYSITTHLFQAGPTKTLFLHIFRLNFWKQT